MDHVGREFFPNLISASFHRRLVVAFAISAALGGLAAVASVLRGVHPDGARPLSGSLGALDVPDSSVTLLWNQERKEPTTAMATLRSSNPAFTSGAGINTPSSAELNAMYATQPRLTVDDVIMHTAGLMALLGVTAVIGWRLSPDNAGLGFAAGLAALALSFAIGFSRVTRPPLVVIFAVLEGLFIGAISHVYEAQFNGIVTQALIGTGVIFGAMLVAYRSGRLRATPRMTKIVIGTLLGVVGLSLIDLGLRAFGSNLPILNDATPLGILLSVGILIVASLQFVLDFDYIERAIAAGAPRSEAWRASYGLLVGFIWVYLELLRLLSKVRR